MEIINSTKNPRVKLLESLRKKVSKRKEKKSILIDGLREIKEAIKSKIIIEEIFWCPELGGECQFNESVLKITQLGLDAFKKVCYKENPDGYLALARVIPASLNSLKIPKNEIILVLERIEKPGNIGAIIRSAWAAGVFTIILNDQETDIFSPNIIRASQGLVFSLPIIQSSQEETMKFLADNKIITLATSLKGRDSYTKINFKKAFALILGSESDGLSNEWQKKADKLIKIPMLQPMDSLNVSVSAAIILFEALRQRGLV